MCKTQRLLGPGGRPLGPWAIGEAVRAAGRTLQLSPQSPLWAQVGVGTQRAIALIRAHLQGPGAPDDFTG